MVVVVVCTIGQYLSFPLNYALAPAAVTPMALLAVGAVGSPMGAIAADRFTDTVIGAATTVAVTRGAGRYFPRRRVRARPRRAEPAVPAARRGPRIPRARAAGGVHRHHRSRVRRGTRAPVKQTS